MRIWKEIWDYAKMIIIVVVIVTLVNSVVLINAKIPSESMEKTIMTGDRIFGFRLAYGLNLDFFGHEISKKIKDPERFDNLIVDKLSYRVRAPKRFEIVVFPFQYQKGTYYIKRIIGLPGEQVQIYNGKVYINDSEIPLDDSFVPEKPRGSFGPYEVPENSYFVLGDNRNASKDSRDKAVGVIKRDQIIGKAWLRVLPFDNFGKLE